MSQMAATGAEPVAHGRLGWRRRFAVDRRVLGAVVAVWLAAGGALAAAIALGGTAQPSLIADPGAVTRWGVPVSRVAQDVTAMCTLGALAVAVFVLPSSAGTLLSDAARLIRLSSRWAAAWAVAALAGFLTNLSEVTSVPLADVFRLNVLAVGLELPHTRALLSSVWLAGLVAIWARWTESPAGGWLLLATGGTALLPPLITGHAGHDGILSSAVISLAVHVGAASLWVGGLVALALHLRCSRTGLAIALPRYSLLALGCFVALGVSGVVAAWSAFADPAQLWATPYGQLLLAKVVGLVMLGGVGHWHRSRTLRKVAAGRPRAFLVLATAELVLMAGVAGVAVGLARTAPPAQPDHGAVSTSADVH